MITLRLFKAADPFLQIDERPLVAGELSIGRDPSVDWPILDNRGDLSRSHCVIGSDGERLWVRDTSSNGVFIGLGRSRATRGETHELRPGEIIYLGEYMILLDQKGDGRVEQTRRPDTSWHASPPAEVAPVMAAPSARLTDAGMMEAFCVGAGLDASAFAGEDPAALMKRLGLVYRQAVNDLCGLMSDRADLKDSLNLDRTTISSRDNNPLKWAPAYRVAIDLLQEGETGFLKGAAAFQASFADLRRHGACLLAASREASAAILQELDPQRIEASAPRPTLGFQSRNEAAWRHFQARHAELLADTAARKGGPERAFRAAYASHLATLDSEGDAA